MNLTARRDAIEEISRRTDLSWLVRQCGREVVHRPNGPDLCLCPFHDDHRPSLNLYKRSGQNSPRFHCFACGAHGDCFDLLKRLRSLDFAQALEWLSHQLNVPLPTPHRAGSVDELRARGLRTAFGVFSSQDDREQAMLREWAERRRLPLPILARADVFAATGNKLSRVSPPDREEREALAEAGLVAVPLFVARPGRDSFLDLPTVSDHFRDDSIIFTIRGPDHSIRGFAARNNRKGSTAPKYLYSRGFARSESLYRADRVFKQLARAAKPAANRDPWLHLFVVEGPVDALRIESLGLSAVAILGSRITDPQRQLIKDLCARADAVGRMVALHLFLDNDPAGRAGCAAALPGLLSLASEAGNLRVDVIAPPVQEPTSPSTDRAGTAKDPDELLSDLCDGRDAKDAAREARERIQAWCVSPMLVLLAHEIGVAPDALPEHWSALPEPTRASALRRLERHHEERWRSIIDRINPFATWLGGRGAGAAGRWREVAERFLLGRASVPVVTPARPRSHDVTQGDRARVARAAALAHSSSQRREFPIDEASWERQARAASVFFHLHRERLARGTGQLLEPMVTVMLPRSGKSDPRLKALPCPEDLVLQQYVLNELLRDHSAVPGFLPLIPAVRYYSNGPRRLETTGPAHLIPAGGKVVSFAYQINMDILEDRVPPKREGIFRPYPQCWQDFLRHLRTAAKDDGVGPIFCARLDIRRFYDRVPRFAVVDVLDPALTAAFSEPGAGECVRMFMPHLSPKERGKRIVDWLGNQSFNYPFYSPSTGATEVWPEHDRGVPQGPDLSAYLANVALFPLDRRMTEVVDAINSDLGGATGSERAVGALYGRYVDDVVIISRSRAGLTQLRAVLESELAKLDMELSKKGEDLPPLSPDEFRAWLTQNRGIGIVASDADASEPPPQEPIDQLDLSPDGEGVDRQTALRLLHDDLLEDPNTAEAEVRRQVRIALRAPDLRHAEYVLAARRLWRCVADTPDTLSAGGAALRMLDLWREVGAPWHAADPDAVRAGPDQGALLNIACPLFIWLEALERAFSARPDRNPTFSQANHAAVAPRRKRLALLVMQGLCEALLEVDETVRSATQQMFKHMLDLRVLVVRRAAAAVIHSRFSVPREDVTASRAVARYRLAATGQLDLALQRRSGDAVLLLHEAITRLTAEPTSGAPGDPLQPIDRQLRQLESLEAAYDSDAIPDSVLQVLRLWVPGSGDVAEQDLCDSRGGPASEEARVVCRDAVVTFLSLAPPGRRTSLISRRPEMARWSFAAQGERPTWDGEVLPAAPGVEVPGLVGLRRGSDHSVLECRGVILAATNRSDNPSDVEPSVSADGLVHLLLPKVEWRSADALSADLKLFTSPSGPHWFMPGGRATPRPTGNSLRWAASAYRGLVRYARFCDSGKTLVPTANNLLMPALPDDEDVPLDGWAILGFQSREADVATQAFIRYGEYGLAPAEVPAEGSLFWRIGTAIADCFGFAEKGTHFESLRLVAPAEVADDGEDWPARVLLRVACYLLRGGSGNLLRGGGLRVLEAKSLPEPVERVLNRMERYATAAPGERLAFVVSTIFEADLLHALYCDTVPTDRSGGPTAVLSAAIRDHFRADGELFRRLPPANPAGYAPIDGPLRRPSLAWLLIATRVEALATADDSAAIDLMAAGARLSAVEMTLRAQTLELWADLSADARSRLLSATPDVSVWGVEADACVVRHPQAIGLHEGIRAALLQLSELTSVGGATGDWSGITPLGWALLLGVLTGMLPSATSTSQVRRGGELPDLRPLATDLAACGVGDEEQLSSLASVAATWDRDTGVKHLRTLAQLDEALDLRVTTHQSADFSLRSVDYGRPYEFRGDGRTFSLPHWQLQVARLARERPRDYEHIIEEAGPPTTDSHRHTFRWTQTRREGKLLGIGLVYGGMATLAGLPELPADPLERPRRARTPQDVPAQGDEAAIAHGGSAATSDPTGADVSHLISGLGASPLDIGMELPVDVPPSPPQGESAHVNGNGEVSAAAAPPGAAAPEQNTTHSEKKHCSQAVMRDAIDRFRAIRDSSWNESRTIKAKNHVRIAIAQWRVDDCYRHPIFETCSQQRTNELARQASEARRKPETWVEFGRLRSCAERRRRLILTHTLRACSRFKVDVLLLPEYSVRPDTVAWIQRALPSLAPLTSVWAGTYRLPANSLSQPTSVSHSPWSAVLTVIAPDRAAIASRAKKYPSVAAGEWFNPGTRAITPTFQSDRATPGRFDGRQFIHELICSEVFLATSPSNMPSLATALATLMKQFGLTYTGRDLTKWAKDKAVEDWWEFANATSYESEFWPRRSILLVPAMTHRAADYAVFGQAGFLASGLSTVFCNAVHPRYASGHSCFVGTNSWDQHEGSAATEAGIHDIGPYHGLFPGLYRQSSTDRGWLGKNEQAVVIADVDPLYVLEGKPRPETLPPPLQLVAHLPLIEIQTGGADHQRNTGNRDSSATDHAEGCSCTKGSSRSDVGVPFVELSERFNSIHGTSRIATTDKDPKPRGIAESLRAIAQKIPDGKWLRRRADAYEANHSAMPAPWPPPTAVDLIPILTEEADDDVEIDVPAYAINRGTLYSGSDSDTPLEPQHLGAQGATTTAPLPTTNKSSPPSSS